MSELFLQIEYYQYLIVLRKLNFFLRLKSTQGRIDSLDDNAVKYYLEHARKQSYDVISPV